MVLGGEDREEKPLRNANASEGIPDWSGIDAGHIYMAAKIVIYYYYY